MEIINSDQIWADETAQSFVERFAGDFESAYQAAVNESRCCGRRSDRTNCERWVLVANSIRNLRSNPKPPRHRSNWAKRPGSKYILNGQPHRPGQECSCQGRNKLCLWCDGSGIVQSKGGTVSFAALGLRRNSSAKDLPINPKKNKMKKRKKSKKSRHP